MWMKVTDDQGVVIKPAKEDGNLASVKTNTDKLDTNLSTRASETTVSGIKSKTDQLTFTGDRLKVDASAAAASEFTRILNGQFADNEQVLNDIPSTSFQNASQYIGVAPATALTSDSTWNIVRILHDAVGNEYKKSIKLAVVWNDRAILPW